MRIYYIKICKKKIFFSGPPAFPLWGFQHKLFTDKVKVCLHMYGERGGIRTSKKNGEEEMKKKKGEG